MVYITELNLVGISSVMLVILFYRRLGMHVTNIGPLCEDMTSSTKPEAHNILQRRQRSHRAMGNSHKELVKFGRVIFIFMSADILITLLCIPPGGGVKCVLGRLVKIAVKF